MPRTWLNQPSGRFFGRVNNDEFHFGGWANLWTVLALLTLRKFGHQVEHFQAACRDYQREVPMFSKRGFFPFATSWHVLLLVCSPFLGYLCRCCVLLFRGTREKEP